MRQVSEMKASYVAALWFTSSWWRSRRRSLGHSTSSDFACKATNRWCYLVVVVVISLLRASSRPAAGWEEALSYLILSGQRTHAYPSYVRWGTGGSPHQLSDRRYRVNESCCILWIRWQENCRPAVRRRIARNRLCSTTTRTEWGPTANRTPTPTRKCRCNCKLRFVC